MKRYATFAIEAVAADQMLDGLVKNTGMTTFIVSEWLQTPNDKLGGQTPWGAWVEFRYEAFAHAASDLCVASAFQAYPELLLATS